MRSRGGAVSAGIPSRAVGCLIRVLGEGGGRRLVSWISRGIVKSRRVGVEGSAGVCGLQISRSRDLRCPIKVEPWRCESQAFRVYAFQEKTRKGEGNKEEKN